MDARATNAYWGRSGLERAILEALAAAGRNVDALTIDDLAPADHFHSGGMNATQRLALDVGADAFDVVWTQNSGMNIPDKEQLYAGFARVLGPGGLLALQEPMVGPVQPVVFPVMWARDAAASFLRAPGEMRAVIEAAGFQVRAWNDVTAEAVGPTTGASGPAHSVQRIAMGLALDALVRAGPRTPEETR